MAFKWDCVREAGARQLYEASSSVCTMVKSKLHGVYVENMIHFKQFPICIWEIIKRCKEQLFCQFYMILSARLAETIPSEVSKLEQCEERKY